MSELEREWQAIDRAIGYVQGFIPAIWAMSTVDEREVVPAESIGEFEEAVRGLACSTARVRELTEVEG